MEKLLNFNTKEEAMARNEQIAREAGCNWTPDGPNVTRYYFDFVENESTRQFALVVPEEEEGRLTGQERAALVSWRRPENHKPVRV